MAGDRGLDPVENSAAGDTAATRVDEEIGENLADPGAVPGASTARGERALSAKGAEHVRLSRPSSVRRTVRRMSDKTMRFLRDVERDLMAALRAGDRVEVTRARKPFLGRVARVNPKGVAVIADDGRRWRIPKQSVAWYLRKVRGPAKKGKTATKKPTPKRRIPVASRRRAPMKTVPRRAGATLQGTSSAQRAQIQRRAKEIAAAYPRQTHFMEFPLVSEEGPRQVYPPVDEWRAELRAGRRDRPAPGEGVRSRHELVQLGLMTLNAIGADHEMQSLS